MATPGVVTSKQSAQPPRWLVAVIVLITAGATVWAMSATKLEGAKVAWDEFEQNVTGIWALPQRAQPATRPDGWARPVAGLTAAPTIAAGATPPHLDRGACTNCHSVASPRGTLMPSIAPAAAPPHANFGPCRNCHVVQAPGVGAPGAGVGAPGAGAGAPAGAVGGIPPAGPYGSFVAGTQPPPAQPPPAVASPPPLRQPTEAEWMGLEVSPAKTGTGVVVGGVESTAARAGMMAGDRISSINGTKVNTMLDFVNATDNGRLPRGAVIVKRGTQRLAFELNATGAAAPPGQMGFSAPGAVPPGMSTATCAPAMSAPAANGNLPGLPPGSSIVGLGAPERRF